MMHPTFDPDWPWTAAQQRVRTAVIDLRKRHGRMPSRAQIQIAADVKSRSYVDRVVGKMKTRGELR